MGAAATVAAPAPTKAGQFRLQPGQLRLLNTSCMYKYSNFNSEGTYLAEIQMLNLQSPSIRDSNLNRAGKYLARFQNLNLQEPSTVACT